jgi:hypothetical protein
MNSQTEEKPDMKKTAMWLAAMCACALLLTVAVNAMPQAPANVAGTWTITMAPMQGGGGGGGNGGGGGGGNGGGGGGGRGGPQTITLKQDGANLTGTMAGRGGDITFTGTVSGTDVTWTVKREMRGTEVTQTYKATVDGDNMKGTVTSSMGNGTPRDFTAARSK